MDYFIIGAVLWYLSGLYTLVIIRNMVGYLLPHDIILTIICSVTGPILTLYWWCVASGDVKIWEKK